MFLTQKLFDRAIKNKGREPWATYFRASITLADKLLNEPVPRADRTRHNWILEQARTFIRYSITLAGVYRLTGNTAYASKCQELIEDVLQWDTWYWEHESSEGYQFDLTTGELAYAFSILLTMLKDWIPPDLRRHVLNVINDRILAVYRRACGNNNHRGKSAHWYTWNTNWNAVCNGGVSCLAYTLAKESGEWENILPVSEKGLSYFIDALHQDGSSVEGIGYWNYGVSYLACSLLCYEQYYGRKHPVLDQPVFREGLRFPFDFSPLGTGISFGDVNRFSPSPIVYALAEYGGQKEIDRMITQRLLQEDILSTPVGPLSCDLATKELFALLFCREPTEESGSPVVPKPRFKVYPDNGWGIFENDGLSLSFRAGSTDEPHAVRDLCSVQLARGGERLLENIVNDPYTLGWFTKGRELYTENQTVSKNSLLINGGGQLYNAASQWSFNQSAMWCEAGNAYPEYVTEVSRKVALLENGFLIADAVKTEGDGWLESRWITRGHFIQEQSSIWRVEKNGQSACLSFHASRPIAFKVCELVNSIAGRESTVMLRVFTKDPVSRCEWECRISR